MKPKSHFSTLSISAAVGLCFSSVPGQGVSVTGLGLFDASWTEAKGVSNDGMVVVGHHHSGSRSFRWTPTGGYEEIPPIGGNIIATEVSADGKAITGQASLNGSAYQAFRWTAESGTVSLGTVPSLSDESVGYGISSDGSVIVGAAFSSSINNRAFRWSESGTQFLPTGIAYATDVSGDGTVVVGLGIDQGVQAFRWTAVTGIQPLPFNDARGVSADGNFVLGAASTANGHEAVRWSQAGGLEPLGDLPGSLYADGAFHSDPRAASADGSVIIGQGNRDLGGEAFIWDQVNGMRSLAQAATALGADLSHWTKLLDATDISENGRFIVGYGINIDNDIEPFLIDLGTLATPSPDAGTSAAGLFGVCLVLHATRRFKLLPETGTIC